MVEPTPFPYRNIEGDAPRDAVDRAAADEAISALLDGELDALAAEHGMDADTVIEALEAWPEYRVRREALGAARALVAAPVDTLDEVTARRLRAHATASDQTRHRRVRVLGALGGAAAALVLFAVGLGLLSESDTTNTAAENRAESPLSMEDATPAPTADGAESADTAASAEALPDVGDVTDPARRAALEAEASPDLPSFFTTGGPVSVEDAPTESDAATGAPPPVPDACIRAAEAAVGAGPTTPRALASASFEDRPALWFVFAVSDPNGATTNQGVVVDAETCAVLAS